MKVLQFFGWLVLFGILFCTFCFIFQTDPNGMMDDARAKIITIKKMKDSVGKKDSGPVHPAPAATDATMADQPDKQPAPADPVPPQ